MFRLMIVEDEPIVLEGMLKIIKFEDLGFNVVCACSNGKEALDKFNEAKPDVVITDICMDLMDGLEFIEKASEINSRTKFVVVSGHQDFKFVKKALSLKVLDYILKPVTAKEFRELLTKIAEELNKKNVSLKQFEQMQKSSDELHKNMFLNELVNLKFGEKEITSYLEKYNINLNKQYFRVLVFKMQDLDAARKHLGFDSINQLLNDFHYKIVKYCSKYENTLSFIATQGYVVVIANDDEVKSINEFAQKLSKKMYNYYTNNEYGLIDCYIGRAVEDVVSISASFSSAAKLIKNGVLCDSKGYFDADYILSKRAKKTYNSKEDIDEWVKNVVCSSDLAFECIDKIEENLKSACYLLSDYKSIASEMVEALDSEFKNMGVDFDGEKVNFEAFSQPELKKYLYELTEDCMEKVNAEGHSKEEYITDKALKYIKRNFGDFNLDLSSVCAYLDISVSYFSSLFKKNTGMTFVMYLNTYRVEKAKYYLENTQRSISEIGEMVGYVDPHYFGIVFKKYTDTTPKRYRTQIKIENEKA